MDKIVSELYKLCISLDNSHLQVMKNAWVVVFNLNIRILILNFYFVFKY